MSEEKIHVRTMAELAASGETPEILFWVGCSGSFDDRAKKITKERDYGKSHQQGQTQNQKSIQNNNEIRY